MKYKLKNVLLQNNEPDYWDNTSSSNNSVTVWGQNGG